MSPESSAIIAVAVAILSAIGTLVNALLSRPKMSAEAKAADTGGEVAISGDAREWVREFRQDARLANEQATAAAERAKAAEERIDELEDKMDLLVDYARTLQVAIVDLGGHPPNPPEDLIPPLSRN